MEKVTVNLSERSYDIVIGKNILPNIGNAILQFTPTKIVIVSNPLVFSLYGDIVKKSIKDIGIECLTILIPDGEEYKTFSNSYTILTNFLENHLDRKSCVVALGGGVIGDITGFAASIYMRGINFIQIPTTLLAQVDSSVGGKTGVNHPLGKNMIGSFYQPKLVWIDTNVLSTLPKNQFLCGISEVIKCGVIFDKNFFAFISKNKDNLLSLENSFVIALIKRACEIKSEIVSKDEKESGLRTILNYGHTIGHAIETETNYTRFLHGEAVSIGMIIEARLAEIMNLIDGEILSKIKSLLNLYELPTILSEDINMDNLISHLLLDKKALDSKITFALPKDIGEFQICTNINTKDIKQALLYGKK